MATNRSPCDEQCTTARAVRQRHGRSSPPSEAISAGGGSNVEYASRQEYQLATRQIFFLINVNCQDGANCT
ncbi:unnamed protein product [Soboliphyme baturini]|uniref:Uncharacterized protein n=1 Tax=Soboliphyme baturini TaxID=241478 RepID=A0A183ISH4_9BILA|nr:unnamed protein product [Soboliphyme baturini]